MKTLVLIVLLCLSAVQALCPDRCVCFRTTVRCMFRQLRFIPISRIDDDTTILDLRFNNIRRIPSGIFRRHSRLNTLLLNNNQIDSLAPNAFQGLSSLQYLYLYKNKINSVAETAFAGLHNLEQLYLHHNLIGHLDVGLFQDLTSLDRLFLQNNRLRTLSSGLFKTMAQLSRLRLDSNSLNCDCNILWLSKLLLNKLGTTHATVTCQTPSRMRGRSLQNIDPSDFNCRTPEFTEEPGDVMAVNGDSARFNCFASGNPSPQISWLHNNEPITGNSEDPSSRYEITGDGRLIIHNTQHADEGVYSCMAINIAGETRMAHAKLWYISNVVPSGASIIQESRARTVTEGDELMLECTAVGTPTPDLTWTRNQEVLRSGQHGTDITAYGSLVISSVLYSHRGAYTCTASNALGSDSVTISLDVNVRPSFTVFPSDQTVSVGEGVVLRCSARGRPAPALSWIKDGQLITMSAGGNNYIISPDGAVLTIERVTLEDFGAYDCIAENPSGSVRAAAQIIQQPTVTPEILTPSRDVRAPFGSNIQLECNVIGHPTPTITWYHANSLIDTVRNVRYVMLQNGNLQIFDVNFADRGLYECIAENSAGDDRIYSTVSIIPLTDDGANSLLGDQFVTVTVEEAIATVSRAINGTLQQLFNPDHTRTPHDLFSIFRLPSTARAQRATKATEIYERTLAIIYDHVKQTNILGVNSSIIELTDVLSPSHLAVISHLSGCEERRQVLNCSDMCYHYKYRTFDGTCNNLNHPSWGGSLTGYTRLIKADYENGFNSPLGWNEGRLYSGHPKPSARRVSTVLASVTNITLDTTHTHMLMQWGQFMDHDLDFTPMAASNARFSDGRRCNETCENEAPCFPIPIPRDDHRIRNRGCIGVTRSSAVCGSGTTSVFYNSITTREQMNEITSFIDGSNIYGSSEEEAQHLRDIGGDLGLLRSGIVLNGKPLLPFHSSGDIDCQLDASTAHVPCFQAGDVRANEQLALTAMHTLWLREHNRVAEHLLRYNPHWQGDQLYHTARKIVGAQLQHITYSHWLPNILGPIGIKRLGEYKGYDPNVNPSIINSFAAAAFRFGHGLVNPIMFRLDEDFSPIPQGNLPLHKAFFAPYRLLEEKGIDPLIRGLFAKEAKKLKPSELLNTELTEKLFMLAHDIALDLAAINIQRGRDHGLPGYNKYRQLCGLQKVDTFHDLQDEISDPDIRRKLHTLYGHPDNIDLWIGGMAEDPVKGALIGPTFMCIIIDQFNRLRHGDRFWYENPGVFTDAQLVELHQTSLAQVICDNSDGINRVQADVFNMPNSTNSFQACDGNTLRGVNIQLWTECCDECVRSGEYNSIAGNFIRKKRSEEYSYKSDPTQENDFEARENTANEDL